MQVNSMTGYASAQSQSVAGAPSAQTKAAPAGRLGIEIRSVNSRFLDLSFRLPDELRSSEPALRELLGAKLKRGKVEVRAAIEMEKSAAVSAPSQALLEKLLHSQALVLECLPHAALLSVADVLRLVGNESQSPQDWSEEIIKLARQGLDSLMGARAREGERLAHMLQGHIDQLRGLAAQAVPLVPQVVEQQRLRFVEKWREAMALSAGGLTPEAAQDRALTEATAFAIRIDVAEELTRLKAHLDELESLIRKGGEIGKRLDFLIQELHREANTMGSKSAALPLTRISVDMKVLIEQMREQVQNIE
jgi:uncharacterized protein (TIGR00255 family)